jgi:hypothetical protein
MMNNESSSIDPFKTAVALTPEGSTKMTSSDSPERPLYVSIEMVANLVYLARHSQDVLDQQQVYLDRASNLLVEIRNHPDLST